jgi:hypothetical protein
MWHACGEWNSYRGFVGKPKGNDLLDVVGRIIIKRILGKEDGVVWTEFIWLRIGITGGLL